VHIVLIEPEIPGNTGSIARLCAGTNTPLHLVGELGFSLEDKYLRRAGLDYWPSVQLHRHDTFEDVLEQVQGGTVWLFSKKAGKSIWDAQFGPNDLLVFGRETKGLPDSLLERFPDHSLQIPITNHIRSLNLANAASVALYESLRQTNWLP
jgi:tRNA (cytidine/uridine-2'-O-)-methyltransferase